MASLENCLLQFLTSLQIAKSLWYICILPIILMLVFLWVLVLYLNDLPDCMLLQLTIYADDSTLFTTYPGTVSPPTCVEASATLNQDLDSVINWGHDRLITSNQKKTHLLSSVSGSKSPFSNSVSGLFTFAVAPWYSSAWIGYQLKPQMGQVHLWCS